MSQGDQIDFVTAEAYLDRYPSSGRSMPVKQYAQTCYVFRDCLCAGVNGQVIMPLNAGAPSNCVLEESFDYNFDREVKIAAFGLAMHKELQEERLEKAAPLFTVWGKGNFWHWMFNCLPKVHVLEAAGFRGHYIVNMNCSYVTESLEMMGIARNRVKHCDRRYYVKNMFFTGRIDGSPETLNLRLLSDVREGLLGAVAPLEGGKRCYVRRIGRRKVKRENEEELLALLAKYDFEVMVPEEHSLAGQISFMTNSVCTIAPHGANAALALFQKRKGMLLECFGQKYVNFCNLPIANLLKLLYIPLPQDVHSGSRVYMVDDETRNDDFTVNLRLVETILGNLKNGSYGL